MMKLEMPIRKIAFIVSVLALVSLGVVSNTHIHVKGSELKSCSVCHFSAMTPLVVVIPLLLSVVWRSDTICLLDRVASATVLVSDVRPRAPPFLLQISH